MTTVLAFITFIMSSSLWPFCFYLLDFLGSVFSAFFRFPLLPSGLCCGRVHSHRIPRAKFKIYQVFRRNHNKSYQIRTRKRWTIIAIIEISSLCMPLVGDRPSCQDSDWLCGSLDSTGSGSTTACQQLAWFRKVGHRGKRRQGAATNIRYYVLHTLQTTDKYVLPSYPF